MGRRIRTTLTATLGLLVTLALVVPSTAPAANALAPAPIPAAGSSLVFNPVANAKTGSVVATFAKADIRTNRKVELQRLAGTGWVAVKKATSKLDSKGKAVFKLTPDDTSTYRAYAGAFTYKVKGKKKTAAAAVTPSVVLGPQKKPTFWDGFDAAPLNAATWTHSLDGIYEADGRLCSAPYASNASVSQGQAQLKMTAETNATIKAKVIADAKAAQKAARDAAIKAANTSKALKAAKAMKIDGCPNGVFRNVRVSTEGAVKPFHIKTGIVAAEITFPKYQGMHGGVWLQSNSGSEIDIIEAFGYRKGIQNVLHVGKYDTPESKKWVAKSAVKKSSWWSKSHVFSIEWTRSQVIFRLDGTVTKTETKALPDADYFLVMSMLSSDWETGRLKKPASGGTKAKLPASMKVNWVKAWAKGA
jgi:hypothetical protein